MGWYARREERKTAWVCKGLICKELVCNGCYVTQIMRLLNCVYIIMQGLLHKTLHMTQTPAFLLEWFSPHTKELRNVCYG